MKYRDPITGRFITRDAWEAMQEGMIDEFEDYEDLEDWESFDEEEYLA
jgi:hypothetical protein